MVTLTPPTLQRRRGETYGKKEERRYGFSVASSLTRPCESGTWQAPMAGMSSRTMRPIRAGSTADRETPVLTHLAHHGGGHPAARRGGDASNRKAPGDGDANIGNRAAAPVFSPLHSDNRAGRRADCDLPGIIPIPDRRSTVASKRASYGTERRSQRRPNRETGRNLHYPGGKAASVSHKNRKLPDTGIALLHLERKHVLTRRRCLDVWQNRSRRPTCISAMWVRYRRASYPNGPV